MLELMFLRQTPFLKVFQIQLKTLIYLNTTATIKKTLLLVLALITNTPSILTIFLLPLGVFYQRLRTKANSGYSTNEYDAYNQSVNLKDRLGFKTDFGYDIANNFSAYIPVGVNFVSYDLKTSDSNEVDFGYKTLSSKHSGRKAGYFYGLGFAFSPIDKISINLEYNRLSKLRIKSVSGATILNHGTIVANTNVDVFKVGLSYNF